MGGIQFSGGGDPKRIIQRWRKAAQPTAGDALYASQRQRSRILERTGRGVSVEGSAFPRYSTKGTYYYNPNGRLNRGSRSTVSPKQQQSAVKRAFRKIVGESNRRKFEFAQKRGKRVKGAPYITPSGNSIAFPGGYAAFKRWLGRSGVDLRGPRAPHMLQGILIKLGGLITGSQDVSVGINTQPQKVDEVRMGIYGRELADRATAHNRGDGKLPRRHFFGASKADVKSFAADMFRRISERLKAK